MGGSAEIERRKPRPRQALTAVITLKVPWRAGRRFPSEGTAGTNGVARQRSLHSTGIRAAHQVLARADAQQFRRPVAVVQPPAPDALAGPGGTWPGGALWWLRHPTAAFRRSGCSSSPRAVYSPAAGAPVLCIAIRRRWLQTVRSIAGLDT